MKRAHWGRTRRKFRAAVRWPSAGCHSAALAAWRRTPPQRRWPPSRSRCASLPPASSMTTGPRQKRCLERARARRACRRCRCGPRSAPPSPLTRRAGRAFVCSQPCGGWARWWRSWSAAASSTSRGWWVNAPPSCVEHALTATRRARCVLPGASDHRGRGGRVHPAGVRRGVRARRDGAQCVLRCCARCRTASLTRAAPAELTLLWLASIILLFTFGGLCIQEVPRVRGKGGGTHDPPLRAEFRLARARRRTACTAGGTRASPCWCWARWRRAACSWRAPRPLCRAATTTEPCLRCQRRDARRGALAALALAVRWRLCKSTCSVECSEWLFLSESVGRSATRCARCRGCDMHLNLHAHAQTDTASL